MGLYKLVLPKMGESVNEATLTNWLKQVGDRIEEDEAVVEIATDKVDSEVPSPVSGVLKEKLFEENQIARVGEAIALIEVDEDSQGSKSDEFEEDIEPEVATDDIADENSIPGLGLLDEKDDRASVDQSANHGAERFYSPLIRSIAQQEGISLSELGSIEGSGADGRLTKEDVIAYLEKRATSTSVEQKNERGENEAHVQSKSPYVTSQPAQIQSRPESGVKAGDGDEIIEMDRMRRLIADHMVQSVHTSPHVFSVVEVDVTNMVNWRNKVKDTFKKREGENITFTPLIIEAIARAIKDFPMINVSVDGYNIIKRKHINIGMAAALPTGNLIVPVIKDADQLSLVGLAKAVNDLAFRARDNRLKPDDTQGGTFTFTNIGAFGNIFGMPIINQPQSAIMAAGTITKKPRVLETESGDVIAVRHMMYLSMSYDHRVIDGALGGTFIKRVGEYLEAWDTERTV